MTGNADWYQQPDGTYRYWDGQQWTVTDADYRVSQAGRGPAAKPTRTGLPAWGWIGIGLGTVVVMCGGLGLAGSTLESVDDSSGTTSSSIPVDPTPRTTDASPPATPPSPTTSTSTSAPSIEAPTPTAAAALPPPPVLPDPPTALASPLATAAQTVVPVIRVVDGDTIETSIGTIRLIGIDTPERGECNYDTATAELAGALAAHGNQVVLAPGATDNTDKYGRLLRYVDTVDGEDLNLHMIATGLATARYDSRDGYGGHPRESDYVAADVGSPAPGCALAAPPPASATPAPQAPAQPAPFAAPLGEPWNQPGPPDLDCGDIGRSVTITGPDYHNLDGDGDGIGCESYG